MKQKILSIILIFAVLLAYMPVVFSSEIVASGSCGENVTYTLDDAGTLTISGTGAMNDYFNGSPESPFRNNTDITAVVVEDGVTTIGSYIFMNCSNLTSITISNSVLRIGDGAFWKCRNITSIQIPDNIESIGDSAFSYCNNLKNITLGSNLKRIGALAFDGCDSLERVYINSIESYLNIDFGTSKNYSYNHSNPMCYATKLYINNRRISGEITIPDTVTTIPEYAFHSCDGITSIAIPESVTNIGRDAFFGLR